MNQWQPVEALKEPVDGFSQLVEEFFYQWQPVEEFAQPVEDFSQPIEEFFIFVSVCVCVFYPL